MNDQSPDKDRWRACPEGELQRTVQGIRTRQRRQVLKRLSAATVSLFLVGGAGYVVADRWLWPGGSPPGGIACNEVIRLLPAYHARKLEPALTEQVCDHLDECPECGPAYQRMVAAKREVAHSHCCGGDHDQRA